MAFVFSAQGIVLIVGFLVIFRNDPKLRLTILVVMTSLVPMSLNYVNDCYYTTSQVVKGKIPFYKDVVIQVAENVSEIGETCLIGANEGLKSLKKHGEEKFSDLKIEAKKRLGIRLTWYEKLTLAIKSVKQAYKSIKPVARFLVSVAAAMATYNLVKDHRHLYSYLPKADKICPLAALTVGYLVYKKLKLEEACIGLAIYWVLMSSNGYKVSGNNGGGGNFSFAEQNANLVGGADYVLPEGQRQPQAQPPNHRGQDVNNLPLNPKFKVPNVTHIVRDRNISDAQILHLLALNLEVHEPNIPRFIVAVQKLEKMVANGQIESRCVDLFIEHKGRLLIPGEQPVLGIDGDMELVRVMRALDVQARRREWCQRVLNARRNQREAQNAARHERAALQRQQAQQERRNRNNERLNRQRENLRQIQQQEQERLNQQADQNDQRHEEAEIRREAQQNRDREERDQRNNERFNRQQENLRQIEHQEQDRLNELSDQNDQRQEEAERRRQEIQNRHSEERDQRNNERLNRQQDNLQQIEGQEQERLNQQADQNDQRHEEAERRARNNIDDRWLNYGNAIRLSRWHRGLAIRREHRDRQLQAAMNNIDRMRREFDALIAVDNAAQAIGLQAAPGEGNANMADQNNFVEGGGRGGLRHNEGSGEPEVGTGGSVGLNKNTKYSQYLSPAIGTEAAKKLVKKTISNEVLVSKATELAKQSSSYEVSKKIIEAGQANLKNIADKTPQRRGLERIFQHIGGSGFEEKQAQQQAIYLHNKIIKTCQRQSANTLAEETTKALPQAKELLQSTANASAKDIALGAAAGMATSCGLEYATSVIGTTKKAYWDGKNQKINAVYEESNRLNNEGQISVVKANALKMKAFIEEVKKDAPPAKDVVARAACGTSAGILGKTIGGIVGTVACPGLGSVSGAAIGGTIGSMIGVFVANKALGT